MTNSKKPFDFEIIKSLLNSELLEKVENKRQLNNNYYFLSKDNRQVFVNYNGITNSVVTNKFS